MERRLILLAAAALVFATVAHAAGSPVRVVDGDTIELGTTTVRLFGIDAPEAGQKCAKPNGGTWPCGKAAIETVETLVAGGGVSCDDRGVDAYGRTLAVCLAGGVDINQAMVAGGHAWAFRRYSDLYAAEEDAARSARRGVWIAATEPPWEYRTHRWEVAAQEAPKGCPIKGNINRSGEHIYHAPWSPWYQKTKINTAAGERWFCSEADAISAGWRAPRWGR